MAIKILGTLFALVVGFSPVISFMLLFNWLRRSAKKHSPRHEGTSIEFYVSPGMRVLLGITVSLLVAFTVLVLLTALSRGGDGWYGVLIPLAVLLAIGLAIPRTIILDTRGHPAALVDRGRSGNRLE
jgi:hypothetical protein